MDTVAQSQPGGLAGSLDGIPPPFMPGQILRACARCARPFKPRHARHRHCERCEEHGNEHRSPTTRTRPSSSTERERIRALVLADGAPCALQYPGCEGLANRVDHIIPAEDGGPYELWNLQPACDFCNSSKARRKSGSPEQGATGGAGRDRDGGSRPRPPGSGFTRLA